MSTRLRVFARLHNLIRNLMSDNEQNGQLQLLVFSNDKSEKNLEVARGLLKMLYHAFLTNKVAAMEAFNSETNTTELILVGVEQNGDSVNCYPILKPIVDSGAAKYLAPDGNGDFVGRQVEE